MFRNPYANKYKIPFLLLLFILCSRTLTAQELAAITGLSRTDYVVTKNNDTIRGRLDDIPSERVRLHVAGRKKPRVYLPEELKKCFTATGDTYIPAYRPDERELDFVKILEYGKIQLYEYYYINYAKEKECKALYAIKKNLKLARIADDCSPSNSGNKQHLMTLIQDNPDLVKLCEPETELTPRVVRDFVKKYNSGFKP